MTNRHEYRFGRPQVARKVVHRKVRHQIQGFKHHVRRAIPVQRLQALANILLNAERQALSRDRQAGDIAAQAIELLAFLRLARHPSVQ